MKLTEYSVNLFMHSFAEYEVPKEFASPIYNYCVYGFQPGGFFTSLLANDAIGAFSRSHPSNTVAGLKNLALWLVNTRTRGILWGDYEIVGKWTTMDEHLRRAHLEHMGLIYSEEKEIWMTLKGEKTLSPILY
jgi:hypothetical protein